MVDVDEDVTAVFEDTAEDAPSRPSLMDMLKTWPKPSWTKPAGAARSKVSTFSAYPSISSRVKDFRAWVGDLQATGVVWVATPKFHGTNFSVTVNHSRDKGVEGVRFGRRNGYLAPTDVFHHYQTVVAKYEWPTLATLLPDSSTVIVYGELYGGVYGTKVTHPVQRSVHYDPDVAFVAFDVAVDGTMLNFYDARDVCLAAGIPFVPICYRGPAEDVYRWAVAHAEDPAISLRRDLPALEGNTGEGFVLRPVREAVVDGDRVLLKVKSKSFDETCRTGGQPGTATLQVSAGSTGLERLVAEAATTHLHKQTAQVPRARVEAVLSKMLPSEVSMGNLPALCAAVVDDVLKDQPDMHFAVTLNELRRAVYRSLKEVVTAT